MNAVDLGIEEPARIVLDRLRARILAAPNRTLRTSSGTIASHELAWRMMKLIELSLPETAPKLLQTVCAGWDGPCPTAEQPSPRASRPGEIARRLGEPWRCRACGMRKIRTRDREKRLASRKPHCLNGHAFDEFNTYFEGGKRRCRACMRARVARYQQRSRRKGSGDQ